MKQEISITQPGYLVEDWPGKYDVFSWLEYIVTVPNPIFFVTTRKANGAPNANLNSWGFLIGEKGNYSILMALLNNSHTYKNILREGHMDEERENRDVRRVIGHRQRLFRL